MSYFKYVFLFFFLTINLSYSDTLKDKNEIGVIVPLTGDFAKYGNKIVKGLNATKSMELKYVFEDEACMPQVAIRSYLKLTSINSIKYFLGPWCGSPQMAIAPMLKNKKQIAILGSSAPKDVFKLSGGRMFSTQHTIEEESIFNAKKSYEMGARKVAIVFFENDFSRAHEKAFINEFKGDVLKTFTYQSFDGVALRNIALQIKKLKPDALYVPDAFPILHGLLKILYQINFKEVKIFSVYSAQSSDILNITKGFNTNFWYSYPKTNGVDALKYFPTMAATIMNKVIKACGSTDTDCGIKYLKKNFEFNSYGVLNGEIILKRILDDKFISVNN